jgi:hypothetical protein
MIKKLRNQLYAPKWEQEEGKKCNYADAFNECLALRLCLFEYQLHWKGTFQKPIHDVMKEPLNQSDKLRQNDRYRKSPTAEFSCSIEAAPPFPQPSCHVTGI